MHIDSYEFGRIIIDGQEFTHDVLIFGNVIHSPWWRIEGHNLTIKDIEDILNKKPTRLIIGTGYSGMMRVDKEVVHYCQENSIDICIKSTQQAAKEFNNDPSAAAAMHLTC